MIPPSDVSHPACLPGHTALLHGVESADHASLRLEAPVIIIGCGGSGSTLFDRMLNAHPAIEMKGEARFLVARAWSAFSAADANTILRNQARHFDAEPGLEARIKTVTNAHGELLRLLEQEETARRAAVMREAISAWFCLGQARGSIWGFKEITNDGLYVWDCYDHIFPEAVWVHIVRNPLQQIRAAARLSGQPLSMQSIPDFLKTWLATVETSRHRRATGRYHEIKYEDLIAAPRPTLSPVLHQLGLGWHEECLLPLARQWGARTELQRLPAEVETMISAIDGLGRVLAELGYTSVDSPSVRSPICPVVVAIGERRWRLTGAIQREIGRCWEVDLSDTKDADIFATGADGIGNWERSSLRLFENDQALGPAHELHYRIRRDGGGGYSHWQNRLLFSTSDNSSPNDNGRTYILDLAVSDRKV